MTLKNAVKFDRKLAYPVLPSGAVFSLLSVRYDKAGINKYVLC